MAPSLNKPELKQLKALIQKSIRENGHIIITNYPFAVAEFLLFPDSDGLTTFFVTAGMSKEDVKDLQSEIKKAQDDPSYVIVTNYEFSVQEIRLPSPIKGKKSKNKSR